MPDQGEVGAWWLRLLGFCPLQRFLYLLCAGLPTYPGPWHRGMYLSQWVSLYQTPMLPPWEIWREGGQTEDPGVPSLSCYGDSLESAP